MNVPKPRKLKSGRWFIQMRLGGKSYSVTADTAKECTREASLIKAEHQLGKLNHDDETKKEPPVLTLDQAIQEYCDSKSNVISPATIRGYQNIRKNQLKEIMQKNIYELASLDDKEWQEIINRESGNYAPKTIKNSVGFIKTVIQHKTKQVFPDVTIAPVPPPDIKFLEPEEIPVFVQAVVQTDVAIPALLALSSMRLSEIQALDWSGIKKNPDFIRTNGSIVPNEDNVMTRKKQNKNVSSSRDVPILIPELKELIKQQRKPSGPIMTCSRSHFLRQIHRVCQQNDITDVTIHGLRHSFASLAYHLQVPEKITQEIGGWSDSGTMKKIYTHISRKDITKYQDAFAAFYKKPEAKDS